MRLLVFDTSFSACSVAVISTSETTSCRSVPSALGLQGESHSGSVLASSYEPMETGQAIRLIPMIEEVMSRASVSFGDLDGLATSPGPGTFTGVRIAVATARALALSTRLPVFEFSSLALLAAKAQQTLGPTGADHVLAATMDARRDAIYIQLFENAKNPPLTKPQLLTPTRAIGLVSSPTIVVGTGAAAFQKAADTRHRPVRMQQKDLQPDATYATGIHMEAVNSLRPLYLRPPDAKPQTGKSIPRVSQ